MADQHGVIDNIHGSTYMPQWDEMILSTTPGLTMRTLYYHCTEQHISSVDYKTMQLVAIRTTSVRHLHRHGGTLVPSTTDWRPLQHESDFVKEGRTSGVQHHSNWGWYQHHPGYLHEDVMATGLHVELQHSVRDQRCCNDRRSQISCIPTSFGVHRLPGASTSGSTRCWTHPTTSLNIGSKVAIHIFCECNMLWTENTWESEGKCQHLELASRQQMWFWRVDQRSQQLSSGFQQDGFTSTRYQRGWQPGGMICARSQQGDAATPWWTTAIMVRLQHQDEQQSVWKGPTSAVPTEEKQQATNGLYRVPFSNNLFLWCEHNMLKSRGRVKTQHGSSTCITAACDIKVLSLTAVRAQQTKVRVRNRV